MEYLKLNRKKVYIIIACFVLIISYFTYKMETSKKLVVPQNKNHYIHNKVTKGSIDVLAIGNSDLFNAFQPLQLFDEYGYTSYAAGLNMQNMSSTYYMLEEILQYQTPKVVILELDNFYEKRGDERKEITIRETHRMCLPLFRFTPAWEQIKYQDFAQVNGIHPRVYTRGYYYRCDVKPNKKGYAYMGKPIIEEDHMIPYFTHKYFPKIMELLYNHKCEVIFLNFPSATTWNCKRHNTVAKYARKYNVPYLDLNIDEYNIGFNWLTDTRDAGNHINYYGAKKMTRFIGEYLKDNYELIDHRGNSYFNEWHESYQYFLLNRKK